MNNQTTNQTTIQELAATPAFSSKDTTYFKKEVKDYYINGLGCLTIVFADGTKFAFYND